MARANFVKRFDLCFEITFSTIICGHHLYKTILTTVIGQELMAKPDEAKEALHYDKFSIGVFKPKDKENKMNTNDDLGLLGHLPMEISSLLECYCRLSKSIQKVRLIESRQ